MPPKSNENDFKLIDASTDEELDALKVNLIQDGDDFRDPDDGSGLIEDDIARDQIEGMTEVGPELYDKGVEIVAPGNADTSNTLRQHHANTREMRAEDLDEADLDEPRNEAFTDGQDDEDTTA